MADPRQAVEAWLDALEALDPDRAIDSLSDDVVIETETLREPIHGKETLRRLLKEGFGAYESIRVDRRNIVASGHEVALLLSMKVRFGKDMELLGETLPTRGKDVEIMGAAFVSVDDAGKIRRVARVRDTLGLVRQLGLPAEQVERLMSKVESATKVPPSRAA